MEAEPSAEVRVIRFIVVLTLLAFRALAAQAQDKCAVPSIASNEAALAAFDTLRRAHCLGGNACQIRDCATVSQFEKKATAKDTKVVAEGILSVLGKLKDSAEALDPKGLGVPQLQQMVKRWSLPSLAATPQSLPSVILKANTEEWQGKSMILFPGSPYQLNVSETLCVPLPPAADVDAIRCNADFQSLVIVYTLSDLIYRTLNTATDDQIKGVGALLKTYDERWTAFHTKSLAVLPWEQLVNNLSYKSAAEGFSGPPDFQWLVVHPSAAVVYDTRQGDKLQPAILMDVIGRYQWRWGGKDNAEITGPLGYSVAMSWHGKSPGYGLALHLPKNWSLAVTRSSGDQWQFITSIELAQYVTDKEKNVNDLRQKLESVRAGLP